MQPPGCRPSKPKLLVILGAGSSIPCGMPSVHEIDKQMKCWGREWKPETRVDAGCDVFNALWKVVEKYYGSNHYCIRPNYERILSEMTALASWLSPPPFGTPLSQAVEDGKPIRELEWLHDCSNKYAARHSVVKQQTFLLEKLVRHMRERCQEFDGRSSEFSDYKEFLGKLREQFDLGIYNLNYDTVACTAWTEAFCGFDPKGTFNPLEVSQRREWGFIYHLHGSVHHCIYSKIGRPRIFWKKDLGGCFSDSDIPQSDMAQNFKPVPLTTLIAGGFKLDQLLADPYQTFYSTLTKHVHEADAILIGGYGFGDLHVNRVLRNRFEIPDNDRPPPKVVILEKSCPKRYRTARLEIHHFWSWELKHALNTTFADGDAPPSENENTVKEFVERQDMEKDPVGRVAIWHGGFCEALCAVDRIVKWLSGASCR